MKIHKHTLKLLVNLCVMWVARCRLRQKECIEVSGLIKEKATEGNSVNFSTLP